MLLIGSFFLLLLLLAAPLRLEIQAAHRQKWEGTLNVQYLMIKHTFLLKKSSVKERDVEVKFDWKQTLEAVWKVIKFSTKRIFVRKCHLDCAIGFAQPTYTAYAYGFVWMVLSILPEWWQENLEVDYIPVFDQPVQKIDFHCIINAPLGNLILITGYVLWLIAREYWQHKERERLAYEG